MWSNDAIFLVIFSLSISIPILLLNLSLSVMQGRTDCSEMGRTEEEVGFSQERPHRSAGPDGRVPGDGHMSE